MSIRESGAEQARAWEILYSRLETILRQLGKEDATGAADYWLLDDNWGPKQHKLYINDLNLLAPSVVKLLQGALAEFPDWEIVVAVALQGAGKSWPEMGLIIRAHQVVDDLKREYLPRQFQSIKYAGSS